MFLCKDGVRINVTKIVLLSIFFASLILTSCAFPINYPEDGKINVIESLDFSEISRQGFMGGSVLYNPDQPASGQLASGVTLAIRLGYVESECVGDDQYVYTDIKEKTQFGKIQITSINEQFLSFSSELFNADGLLLNRSTYTLRLDDAIDINSDGIPDIEYKKPLRKRLGFESAVYLTFLSSQETLTTSMFAVLPGQYSRGVYPSGIIGVNPDGKFIIRKYEDVDNTRRSLVVGLQKGDYVLDSLEGKYQRVVNTSSARGARSISDNELADIEGSSIPTSYLFELSEFVHGYSPDILFDALPDNVKSQFIHIDSSIERLNAMLAFNDLISLIAEYQDTPIPVEIFEVVVNQINYLNEEEKIQLNRTFLEETYPQLCPERTEESLCFTEILPLVSIRFGETEQDPFSSDLNEEFRAATVSEYESQRASMEKEFKTYKEVFKKVIKIPVENKDNKANISFTNSYIALGFRGEFNVVFGSVYGKVEGAVYVNADTNIESNISFKKDLFANSTTLNVPVFVFGPIFLNLSVNTDFTIPLNISLPAVSTAFKMRAAVTGLYGAGFDVGLKYGIKMKKVWIIKLPIPYFDWNGNKWAHNKTVYYAGTDSKNSVSFNGVSISITPTVSAGIGANISEVVSGDINAGAGLKSYLNVKYEKPVLTGTAGLDLKLSLKAKAYIGLKNTIIGPLGKGWSWDILKPKDMELASWQVFKTNL